MRICGKSSCNWCQFQHYSTLITSYIEHCFEIKSTFKATTLNTQLYYFNILSINFESGAEPWTFNQIKILQRSIIWIRAALIFRQKRGNFAIPTISNWKESVSLVRRRTRPITPLPEIFVKGEQSRRKVSEVPLLYLVVATMHRFIIRGMMITSPVITVLL